MSEFKKCCGNCRNYLTDEDEYGNVAEFRHDRSKPAGFCANRDLFYGTAKNDDACEDWVYDDEEE